MFLEGKKKKKSRHTKACMQHPPFFFLWLFVVVYLTTTCDNYHIALGPEPLGVILFSLFPLRWSWGRERKPYGTGVGYLNTFNRYVFHHWDGERGPWSNLLIIHVRRIVGRSRGMCWSGKFDTKLCNSKMAYSTFTYLTFSTLPLFLSFFFVPTPLGPRGGGGRLRGWPRRCD